MKTETAVCKRRHNKGGGESQDGKDQHERKGRRGKNLINILLSLRQSGFTIKTNIRDTQQRASDRQTEGNMKVPLSFPPPAQLWLFRPV